jgi:hypothetical protein
LFSSLTVNAAGQGALPPGTTRTSIATHAYEKVLVGSPVARTAGRLPQQACVVTKSFATYDDTAVKTKTRPLGSATVKNH